MRRKSIRIIALLSLTMLIISSVSAFAVDKTLMFEKQNGKMVMHSIRSDEGNWFMDFTNMIPGDRYHDQLNIDNQSSKTFKLYMQVIPLEQEEIKDTLLDKIYMEVLLDGKQIYTGTAKGKDYGNGDLTKVIYLGQYEGGDTSVIKTNLQLDKDLGLEYCDILTKIDWKFMVTEVNGEIINTGDESPIMMYVAILGAALAALLLVVLVKKHRRDAEDR